MKVNVNHPSFISFIESVTNQVFKTIDINHYFTLKEDDKFTVLVGVFNLIKTAAKLKTKLTDDELKSFVNVLRKKNEQIENYEFSAILNDIIKDYNRINDMVTPKKVSRTPKKTVGKVK